MPSPSAPRLFVHGAVVHSKSSGQNVGRTEKCRNNPTSMYTPKAIFPSGNPTVNYLGKTVGYDVEPARNLQMPTFRHQRLVWPSNTFLGVKPLSIRKSGFLRLKFQSPRPHPGQNGVRTSISKNALMALGIRYPWEILHETSCISWKSWGSTSCPIIERSEASRLSEWFKIFVSSNGNQYYKRVDIE